MFNIIYHNTQLNVIAQNYERDVKHENAPLRKGTRGDRPIIVYLFCKDLRVQPILGQRIFMAQE